MSFFGFLYLSFLLSLFPFSGSVPYGFFNSSVPSGSGTGQSHCSWFPAPSAPQEPTKHLLMCELRKLGVDFLNYTAPPTPDYLKHTTQATLHCNAQLLFESSLPLFDFPSLESLEIQNCKIRKIESSVLRKLSGLKRFVLQSHNGEWSGSVGLEVGPGGFDWLVGLRVLDLAHNNIWTLADNLFCPLGSLERLNLSWNRLSQVSLKSKGTDCALSESLVYLDLSKNTIRTIGQNTFGKLTNLKELKLEGNVIDQVESSALIGLNQLKLLNLSSNRIVSFPENIFQNNQLLQILHLGNNFLVELQGNEFGKLENLRELYIQSNQIQFISNQTFLSLKRLEILVLENNLLENLDPQLFSTLTQLRHLDLSRNRLLAIEGSPFSALFDLRQLYLDYNQLRHLEDTIFVNNSNLRDLGLGANLLSEVPLALRFGPGLGALESLDLGENRIAFVTNESFSSQGHVYGLRLVGNRLTELPSGFCSALKKLHVLNLSQNRINKISNSAFTGCPDLKALRLDRNDLEELPIAIAPQLPSLLWLNVSENRLRRVSYPDLPVSLEWLDLSKNQLIHVGGFSPSPVTYTSRGIKGLPPFHLRVLDVSFNNLTHLDSSIISPKLETLRVNFNQLQAIAPGIFFRALRVRRVELIGNQLTSLPLSSLRLPLQGQSDRPLVELLLGGNPFLCDCAMEWLTSTGLGGLYPKVIDLEAIKCTSVSSRRPEVIALPDMNVTDFLCPYTSHCFALCQCCDFEACDCAMECPENCTCYHDSSWQANVVECSNLGYAEVPSRIPMDASEILLDGNNFRDLGSHIFIGKKNVKVLYLNGSDIEIIRNKTFNGLRALQVLRLEDNFLRALNGHEFADVPNLVELYLQNNLISSIAPSTFANLKNLHILRLDRNRLMEFAIWDLSANINLVQIQIAENPWSCSCPFLIPFKTWIESKGDNSVVMDYELARCQVKSNGSWPISLRTSYPAPVITPEPYSQWTLPIGSTCSGHGEGDITAYAENGILDDGVGTGRESDGVRGEKIVKVIDHSQHEISGPERGIRQVTADHPSESESSRTFWTFSLAVSAILVLVIVVVLIFRLKIFMKCRSATTPYNFTFCPGRSRRVGSAEKVGDDCSTFLSDTEDTKLFDMYFLYNEKDEDLLTTKVTPDLEAIPLRLLLHYRDLCPGHQVNTPSNNDSEWNPDVTLSAADTSKVVVMVLSKSFLEEELCNPVSRLALQLVIHRFSTKVLFILLPPLDHFGISAFFPGLRSKTIILDWLDPDFWPKFRVHLPAPANQGACDVAQAQLHTPYHPQAPHLQAPHQSLPHSQYQRNITPYQLQVPHAPYQGTTLEYSTLGRASHHPYYSGSPESTWQAYRPGPAIEPTYNTSFAENFRFHQRQNQTGLGGTLQRKWSRNLPSASPPEPARAASHHHTYRPLIRTAPPHRQTHHLASPNCSTTDSGNVNGSCSSDELENEHVYSTLDSPLQSPIEHDDVRGVTNAERDDDPPSPAPPNRIMYFV